MGLFTDGFKLLKKASEPLYKTPKSIQETIEIMAVAENGIFEVSRNKYSKCYRFQDINYTTATEDEQIGIFERYCKFLNSLDCNYKITINNKNKNMEDLRDKVLITEKNDGFNNYRRIYNDIIEEKIIEGRQGIEQERYLTITIERKNFEEAKAQFATLEATIHKAFIELGAEIVPLNGNERLKVLYDYYHLGDEGSFDFDIKKAKKVGADFKNDLCNGMVKYFPDHFEDESKYCKALFIKKYPSSLSDRFINEITSLPVHSITSIDVVPVPKDLTTKVLQKKYLGIESDIIKQQRVRNKNNDFSTEISYAKRTEKKEIEAIMDDVRENDQCLFFVGVTIILMAESKKELESVCETVETIGKRNSCTIDTHYLKQREALNTALPIGVRQVETMRTLLTQSLAVLMPFNVQELNDSTGNYYGINQISKNVNIGNRKKLINGNGFVFGVPGSGKSFFCKMEMGSVFLSGDDEIIVIDPMNGATRWQLKRLSTYPMLIQAYVQMILAHVFAEMPMVDKSTVGSDDLIYNAVEYVAKNFREKISLEKMAYDLCVSKYVLSRMFAKTFHCNFSKYVNGVRLNYAVTALENTMDSITNICLDCGFESQRTFNRVFKEKYKITPREYRKRIIM